MVLRSAWHEYLANAKVALAFALLGAFVFFFVLFADGFISSGSVFFEYSLLKSGAANAVFEIVALLVYLLFFSVFLSVLIFAVRHDLNEVKMQHYLVEKLPKFVLTNFSFLAVFSLALIAAAALLLLLGLPNFVIAIILFCISAVFMFVPQAIVVDEENTYNAMLNAMQFFLSNLKMSAFIVLVASVLVFFIPLIEIFFDTFSFSGRFVSLFIILLFVLPFVEVLKTVTYLTKFELIKSHI